MTAHRALPLSVVEARARDSRKAWNSCTQDYNQGRACTCAPKPAEAATDVGAEPEGQPLTLRELVRFWATTAAPAVVAGLGYVLVVWGFKP